MKTIGDLLKEHHFFKDLNPNYISTIESCGKNVIFEKGKEISREGDPADQFYIIREGKVAIDLLAAQHGTIIIQTLGKGEVFGFSWIIPPFKWRFTSRAMETTHAVALDGKCLRNKCEKDHEMGYEFLKRFSSVLAQRLEMTRLQLLDIYGVKNNDTNIHTG